MKTLVLSLCLLAGTLTTYAQNYQVATYNRNGTPTNGVKIKTNLPFTNSSQMPTIILEGLNYGSSEPIGLILTYYIFNNAFSAPRISSFGGYAPPVYLASENNKVVIFIDDRSYYSRFTIRAFAQGMPSDTAGSFVG